MFRSSLLALCLVAPGIAVADFEAGMEAFQRGDDARALAEWAPLATDGLVAAQFNLGLIYTRDRGVAVDHEQAFHWFHQAAEAGYTAAEYRVAKSYEAGRGVKQDLIQAHVWFSLAAAEKYSDARKLRNRVAKRLTPHQLALAQMHARHRKQERAGKP